MAPNSSLEFRKLPLVEVAVRASFHSSIPLRYSLINAVREKLSAEFPTLAELNHFEAAPGSGGTQFEISPGFLPGAVYTGHKSGLSISLQPQVIVARWVTRPGLQQTQYPRFGALRESIWTAEEAFRKSAGDEYPGIAVVNMSYVNFVPATDSATFAKTYLSTDAQMRIMDGATQVRKLEAAWSGSEDIDVRFAIEQAAVQMGERVTPGFSVTTAAGLRLGASQDAKSGLDKVHGALQEFFLKLISNEARREWELQE